MSETEQESFARGQKAGRIDALLEEHSVHLAKINGSVERAAKAEEALAEAVQKLDTHTLARINDLEKELKEAIREVASDVRTLNEDARLRDDRDNTSRVTLAKETERRRIALAEAERHGLSKRQSIGLALSTIAVLLTVLGLYLAYH